MKDELRELVQAGTIRNRLLMAKTLQAELRAAAERVVRLSQAGTPERLFTLQYVAEESGLAAHAIVKAIQVLVVERRESRK